MPDADAIAAVRGWLNAPSERTGVYLADDRDGWDFRSYRDLADDARRVATALRRSGIGTADTVEVAMATSYPSLAAMFAVLAAGATLTPVPPGTVGALTIDAIPDVPPLAELVEPGPDVLLQLTSGSTSRPRGVRIGWRSLAVNLAAIDTVCRLGPADATTSWLPLYHDMGLIGVVFQAVTRQRNLYLMRPDQFVRDPARWLRSVAESGHTVAPPFGLAYTSRRLRPADIADIDLSGVRTVVVGAEPITTGHLRAFTELTAAQGFSMDAFLPCYGMAEATLIATAGDARRTVRVDTGMLTPGEPVRVLTGDGPDALVSAGVPIDGHRVRIAGTDREGVLGEIVFGGESVFAGYRGEAGEATRLLGDELYTGDAGFLLDGQLYVLGRMGTSLKCRGRMVFVEDLDATAATALRTTPNRVMTVAVPDAGRPGMAVFVEKGCSEALADLTVALTAVLGEEIPHWVVEVPRGGLARTSSGKPRRSHMWQQWRVGRLVGAELLAESQLPVLAKVRALFDKARELAVIPDDATVHFEGSLAEGFGNDGSDIDLLLLLPGTGAQAVMPTVLFIDGRRVEIRAQSHEQIRKRLHRIREVLDGKGTAKEDTLNRVQRFLRGKVLRIGPDYAELRSVVSYPELTDLLARWWQRRADQCLRQAVALQLLGADGEAVSWAREGLCQSTKAYLARNGEGYVEVKWLPLQIARLAQVRPLPAEYAAVESNPQVDTVLALSRRLGGTRIDIDPGQVTITRVPGVTTWPIRETTHVVRGRCDLFVLSPQCAQSWRRVVFGQSLAESTAAAEHLRLFARHGFIGLAWRGAGPIRPVAAMCDPSRPLTPPPSTRRPMITIDGAPTDGPIARSPLPAKAFAEAASALILANMVLENAREDYDGSVKDAQWQVSTQCGRRIVLMAVRILATAWGVTPLPGDPVLLHGLETLVPEHPGLADRARELSALTVADHDDALRVQDRLDEFVCAVQEATGGQLFPASFTSRTQWQETLRYGYQWLRLGGYLDAYLELDEARDLLASGGAQPAVKAAVSS